MYSWVPEHVKWMGACLHIPARKIYSNHKTYIYTPGSTALWCTYACTHAEYIACQDIAPRKITSYIAKNYYRHYSYYSYYRHYTCYTYYRYYRYTTGTTATTATTGTTGITGTTGSYRYYRYYSYYRYYRYYRHYR